MKKIIIFFTTIGLAYSQSIGMLANPGESIFGIEGQYYSEDVEGGSVSVTSLGGSYILNGNLEFGVFYDMGEFKSDNSDLDYNVDGLTYGAYYHMKENATLPLSLKIGAFYRDAIADADWLDDAGAEISTEATSFGGGVYKNIYEKDLLTIKGFFNLHLVSSEIITEIEENDYYYAYYDSETDDYNSTRIGLAIRNGNIFIEPSIGRIDGESSFYINFGLLLTQ